MRQPLRYIPAADFNPLPPHGGRRSSQGRPNSIRKYFNPLPPHGGRPTNTGCGVSSAEFQSTPSAWRETAFAFSSPIRSAYFNPLPPHGGRPCKSLRLFRQTRISIHSLRMEGDSIGVERRWSPTPFQSTPSAWRETPVVCVVSLGTIISIHSLRMEGDHRHIRHLWRLIYFNPLPPHGGRQNSTRFSGGEQTFQSTPSAWRETVSRRSRLF